MHDDPDTLVGESLTEITERLFSSSPPQEGAIDVMTMHAAKGLEWDVVILPCLGRTTANNRDRLLHWIELPRAEAQTDLLLAPFAAPIRSRPRHWPATSKNCDATVPRSSDCDCCMWPARGRVKRCIYRPQ